MITHNVHVHMYVDSIIIIIIIIISNDNCQHDQTKYKLLYIWMILIINKDLFGFFFQFCIIQITNGHCSCYVCVWTTTYWLMLIKLWMLIESYGPIYEIINKHTHTPSLVKPKLLFCFFCCCKSTTINWV